MKWIWNGCCPRVTLKHFAETWVPSQSPPPLRPGHSTPPVQYHVHPQHANTRPFGHFCMTLKYQLVNSIAYLGQGSLTFSFIAITVREYLLLIVDKPSLLWANFLLNVSKVSAPFKIFYLFLVQAEIFRRSTIVYFPDKNTLQWKVYLF